jgi:hypothetical protein
VLSPGTPRPHLRPHQFSELTNPIESVFATVRHRTVRSKGALSQDTARLMVFKMGWTTPDGIGVPQRGSSRPVEKGAARDEKLWVRR